MKRKRVTISLEALPAGTVLMDKNGRHWKLESLQTRDDQGILYEGTLLFTSGQVLGWARPSWNPAKGRGHPFLRTKMEAIAQLHTCL